MLRRLRLHLVKSSGPEMFLLRQIRAWAEALQAAGGSERGLMPSTNEALRAHVTRTGFDLNLGKTHIAALVYVDTCCKCNQHIHRPYGFGVRDMFVTGVNGLISRGLVWHRDPVDSLKTPWNQIYGLTKAGKLVRGLLKESGLWDEYSFPLPVLAESAA